MKLVKSCKAEHNIATGATHLQLGTYRYYREMDPSFSIADWEEGTIRYAGNIPAGSPIALSPEQFNAITGGNVAVTGPGVVRPPPLPGAMRIDLSGCSMAFEDDKVLFSGAPRISYTYPNAYMFCMSLLDDSDSADPGSISPEYDSSYQLSLEGVQEFGNRVARLLLEQLQIQDLDLTEMQKALQVQVFSAPAQVSTLASAVSYKDSREIELMTPEDFTANGIVTRYHQSLFEKQEKYRSDREFRFVFLVHHQHLGPLPVATKPMLLDICPLGGLVSS